MIESKTNEKVKKLNKLKLKKFRDIYNEFLVFDEDIIKIAFDKNLVKELYTTNPSKKGELISKNIMTYLKDTKTPYERVAVVSKFSNKEIKSNNILILDEVQDPKNLGALIRSALAFNFRHIIISNHSADVFHEEVIRTSKGYIFDVLVERVDLVSKIKELKKLGYTIIGTSLNKSDDITTSSKKALILGNEGRGISTGVLKLVDKVISIKTNNVESLNVLAAGSILMNKLGEIK